MEALMFVNKIKIIAFLILIIPFSGCAIDENKYQYLEPEFELFEFFSGEVKAWGIVQDYSGDLVQRFTVDMEGVLEDGVLTLNEIFSYDLGDGVEQRTWILEPSAKKSFVGRASDIEGFAEGNSYGNAFNFKYEMNIQISGDDYRVHFDDWFWAFDKKTIVNRSYIKKFGFTIAEVTIFMQKP